MDGKRKVPDHKLLCLVCNTYYPNERSLAIHEYIHDNDDLNTFLSFSLCVKSNSLPIARYYSIPKRRRGERSPKSKVANSPGQLLRGPAKKQIAKVYPNQHRILSENSLKLIASTDISPYLLPLKKVYSDDHSPFANTDLLQFVQRFPPKAHFTIIPNSRGKPEVGKTDLAPESDDERTTQPDGSPDSGLCEVYDSPSEKDSESNDYESATSMEFGSMLLKPVPEDLNSNSVHGQKIGDNPCSGNIETMLSEDSSVDEAYDSPLHPTGTNSVYDSKIFDDQFVNGSKTVIEKQELVERSFYNFHKQKIVGRLLPLPLCVPGCYGKSKCVENS